MWDAKTIKDIAEWAMERYGEEAGEHVRQRAERRRLQGSLEAERDWLAVLVQIYDMRKASKNGH